MPVILIDSVYRKDENYYPKVLLEKFIYVYKSFLSLRLQSSVSWNIRNFSERFFFYFSRSESSLLKYFILRAGKFHFLKYKKSFFWENIRIFLILGLESSIFLKYKENFFWENIRKYFGTGFLIFRALCITTYAWKVSKDEVEPGVRVFGRGVFHAGF